MGVIENLCAEIVGYDLQEGERLASPLGRIPHFDEAKVTFSISEVQ
jgi:hypothetical protein